MELRTPSDLVLMNACTLSQKIRMREVSCVEVMRAYLDHIARFNPRVNAIVSLRDEADLLAEAAERDRELARGEVRGWLHGLPQAIKDLAATRGIRTTQGSPLFRDTIPAADAIFVERIRAAGAILIGKTNTPEFGLGSQTYNPVFGPTRNAFDQTRTAGGSSGGAAVALALRMLPVADGSDHAGSLRNPAAFNNVLGLRPSFGRVPSDSEEVFLPQLGVAGPMARTVEDLAALLSVQSGYDARAPLSIGEDPARLARDLTRDFKGTRIGWLGDLGGYLPLEEGILDLCGRGLAALERVGCTVEAVLPDFPPEAIWNAWLVLRAWLVGSSLAAAYRDPAKRALLKPEAQWEVEQGAKLSAFAVAEASKVRTAWYHTVRGLFEAYDYLVLPSAQVFPFAVETPWPRQIAGRTMDTYHRWMEVVIPVTMSGCPAISVPVGFNGSGLPMGMQIVAPNRGEHALLQIARSLEEELRWGEKRPPILDVG
ncbi:amidase [Arenibaculum pallidiluteum]|uniref:amidase n=1 Tax=Arenibaculum pallidiluteum TaxID=2812559 RepID=UPI001A95ECB8|nr:amidase [Arenibaculum pallidiluteum]